MSGAQAPPTPTRTRPPRTGFSLELRTRITTQPLPYQYGVEARALESLWEVFGQARAAMKNYPGCASFARRTTEMLNVDLRPMTAKWHRRIREGRLNSRDGANEFRDDLASGAGEAARLRGRASSDGLRRARGGRADARRHHGCGAC